MTDRAGESLRATGPFPANQSEINRLCQRWAMAADDEATALMPQILRAMNATHPSINTQSETSVMPDGSTMSTATTPRARRSTARNPDARLIQASAEFQAGHAEIDRLCKLEGLSGGAEVKEYDRQMHPIYEKLTALRSEIFDTEPMTFAGLRAKAAAAIPECLITEEEMCRSLAQDVQRLLPEGVIGSAEISTVRKPKRAAKNPDARLITVCHEMVGHNQASRAVNDKLSKLEDVPSELKAEADRMADLELIGLVKAVRVPAQTFAGIHAKAKAYMQSYGDRIDSGFARSIMRDILEIGADTEIPSQKTNVSVNLRASDKNNPDKTLLDLVEKYFQLKAELYAGYERTDDMSPKEGWAFEEGEGKSLRGRMDEIEGAVEALTPQTIEGFAAKARVTERILLFYHGYTDGTPPDLSVDMALSLCRNLAANVSTVVHRPDGEVGDADLIRICDQHIANHAVYNARAGELPIEEDPRWDAYERTSGTISDAKPRTLAGLAAKARAIVAEATTPDGTEIPENEVPWMWDLVNDVIRLDGERKPDAVLAEPDAELIAIAQQIEAAEQKIYDYNKDLIQLTEDELNDALDIGHKGGRRLLSMRPTTSAGLMAKAKAVRLIMENTINTDPGETVESMGELDQLMAWSLVNDVVSGSPLPGLASVRETPLSIIGRRLGELNQRLLERDDDADDGELVELTKRAMSMQPVTLLDAGVLALCVAEQASFLEESAAMGDPDTFPPEVISLSTSES